MAHLHKVDDTAEKLTELKPPTGHAHNTCTCLDPRSSANRGRRFCYELGVACTYHRADRRSGSVTIPLAPLLRFNIQDDYPGVKSCYLWLTYVKTPRGCRVHVLVLHCTVLKSRAHLLRSVFRLSRLTVYPLQSSLFHHHTFSPSFHYLFPKNARRFQDQRV